MTTLRRVLPADVWYALAYLHQAGTANCATLAGVDGVDVDTLAGMAADPALIVIRQAGHDHAPPRWLTRPAEMTADLTTTGQHLSRVVVALAGALLTCTRTPVTRDRFRKATQLDDDHTGTLLDHGLIEPVDARGEPCRPSRMVAVRTTRKGRTYAAVAV